MRGNTNLLVSFSLFPTYVMWLKYFVVHMSGESWSSILFCFGASYVGHLSIVVIVMLSAMSGMAKYNTTTRQLAPKLSYNINIEAFLAD